MRGGGAGSSVPSQELVLGQRVCRKKSCRTMGHKPSAKLGPSSATKRDLDHSAERATAFREEKRTRA